MNDQQSTVVEFIGGPYDGHRQLVHFDKVALIEAIELPINQNVLRAISGESPGPMVKTMNMAIYFLKTEGDQASYEYLTQRMVREEERAGLNQWCRGVARALDRTP